MEQQQETSIVWSKQRTRVDVGDIVHFTLIQDNVAFQYMGEIHDKVVSELHPTVYKIGVAFPPGGDGKLEFPSNWSENKDGIFEVPWYHCSILYDFCRTNVEDMTFFKKYPIAPLDKRLKRIVLHEHDWDHDLYCTIDYDSYWRIAYQECLYVIDQDETPCKLQPLVMIHEDFMIGGEQEGYSRNTRIFNYSHWKCKDVGISSDCVILSKNSFMERTHMLHRTHRADSEFVTKIPAPVQNAEKMNAQQLYRSTLQNVVKRLGLSREVVNVVKELNGRHYMFTQNNLYCKMYGDNEHCVINLQLDHQFLTLQDGGFGHNCNPNDVLYGYVAEYTDRYSKKTKEKFIWMVSDEYDYFSSDSCAVSKLDTFMRFVASGGKAKMFQNKTDREIVEMCYGRGKPTPLSDLLEGWFDPFIVNGGTVGHFRAMYL